MLAVRLPAMVTQDSSFFKRFAILVGIDAYPKNPLKACVRDVKHIQAYLDGLSPGVDVTMMVAGRRSDVDPEPSDDDPTEASEDWPTVKNILAVLDRVNSMSKAGDFVYVHFSGHGTRSAFDSEDEFSNQSTGDLALVLLDEQHKRSDVQYLWGSQLANSLKRMADRKVVVSLVLDCCFSAAVYRNDDPEIRFLPYDRAKTPDHDGTNDQIWQAQPGDDESSRQVSMLPNWLMNPDGYAIVSACGPHEVAREPRFDGENRGALSYFLLRALDSVGVAVRHRDIYAYVCAYFKRNKIPQHPVLYGNRLQAFLAPPMSEDIRESVSVVEKRGSLQLQAGIVHGIEIGDQFLLSPLASTGPMSGSQPGYLVAHITNTKSFTSNLELLYSGSPPAIRVKTGWVARPLTRSSLNNFPVHLDKDLPNQVEWIELLTKRSLAMATEPPFSFNIVLKDASGYKILDGEGQPIPNTPTIAQDGGYGPSHVCDIIEHLARFKFVETLSRHHTTVDHLSSPFRQSFKLHLSHKSADGGEVITHPGALTEIQHGKRAWLMLENVGQEVLYLYIYNMSCLGWRIENILKAGYESVPPRSPPDSNLRFGGKYQKRLKFTIPPRETMQDKVGSTTQCRDIIKVFVTSQPTNFDLLELPELGGAPKETSVSGGRESGGDEMEVEWEAFGFPVHTYLPT